MRQEVRGLDYTLKCPDSRPRCMLWNILSECMGFPKKGEQLLFRIGPKVTQEPCMGYRSVEAIIEG